MLWLLNCETNVSTRHEFQASKNDSYTKLVDAGRLPVKNTLIERGGQRGSPAKRKERRRDSLQMPADPWRGASTAHTEPPRAILVWKVRL